MDDQNALEEAARAEAVVAQWGEPFRELASHPRVEFDGDSIVLKLWKPIKVSGEETAELRIREPNLEDVQKVDGVRGDVAQARRMIVSVAAVTEREAGQIGMRDFATFSKVLEAFSGAAPTTGATR